MDSNLVQCRHVHRLHRPHLPLGDSGLQCVLLRLEPAFFVASARAIFSKHLALCFAGPARRTSHKLLERIIEFVEHVGFGKSIVEKNMENMRVRTLSNASKTSLVRSFPSNVGVRRCANQTQSTPVHTRCRPATLRGTLSEHQLT